MKLATKNKPRKFREEIEGLRAVAAILVAIYHIWFGNVSGGVDVFFVVSGFLITTSLLNRYERSGKVNIFSFLTRLAKRLFPAGFTVLLITTIACIIWLPQVRWFETIKEIFATAFYYQNWQLANNAVDYLAENSEASPFQHFWAMSIQGQFYIIWPILLIVSIILARYIINKSVRNTFLYTLLIVFFLSFTYSIYLTNVNQPWAYFDTFTRVWEFSLGGILAILIPYISFNNRTSFVLGWIGLFGLISCGAILKVSTVFPGYAALWPTLSAVFILIAGNRGGKYSVHRFLSLKPLMKFGGISYSFYLWHWPILIFYFIISGNDSVSLLTGSLILILSTVLAYITTKFIESPIRKSSKFESSRNSAVIASSFMIPVVLIATMWFITIQKQNVVPAFALEHDDYPGAMYLAPDFDTSSFIEKPLIPTALQARNDIPKVYEDGCHQNQGNAEVIECEYGVTSNETYTIALVGGSHSAHWLPALEKIAEKENIKILSYTKSACRFTTQEMEDDCLQWNENLVEILIHNKPDLVFTTADVGGGKEVPKGFIEQWEKLNIHDIKILAIRDNPWFRFDVPTCVEENGRDSAECYVEREQALSSPSAWDNLNSPPENVHYIDLSDFFCEEDLCKPVIGNVLVYRDSHHITVTYSESLAPILYEELMPIIEK